MARIQIQGQRDGIDEITLIGKDHRVATEGNRPSLYNPKELLHHTGRMPRGLFGASSSTVGFYKPSDLGRRQRRTAIPWVIQYCGHEGEPGGEATGQNPAAWPVWEVVKHLAHTAAGTLA